MVNLSNGAEYKSQRKRCRRHIVQTFMAEAESVVHNIIKWLRNQADLSPVYLFKFF